MVRNFQTRIIRPPLTLSRRTNIGQPLSRIIARPIKGVSTKVTTDAGKATTQSKILFPGYILRNDYHKFSLSFFTFEISRGLARLSAPNLFVDFGQFLGDYNVRLAESFESFA